MRRVKCFTIFLSVLFVRAACGQSLSSRTDEAAIRDLVQKYVDARNGRDAEKIRSVFTLDADQLVSTGEWRKGIDAVVQGAMASSRKEAAKSSIRVEAVRFLEPDMALADGRYETASAVTNANRRMWTTLVVKRTDHGWRIAAIRNMLPAPAPSRTPREKVN